MLRPSFAAGVTVALCALTIQLPGNADTSVRTAAHATAAHATAGARAALARTGRAARPGGSYDWQAMGRDNTHQAYENDSNMSVAIAPSLGINWMTNLLSPFYGGPSIAFNPTVNKTLVYSGDQRGNFSAFDESNGQTIWSTSIGTGDGIYSTPTISSDESSVWFGSVLNPQMYKLNAATGQTLCSAKTQLAIQMSPTEGTSSNGTPQIYFAAIDSGNIGGPEMAVKESDCSPVFSVNPYKVPHTGSWASPAYGVDKNGKQLIIQGTADPDSSEYAIDATTGVLDWSFSTGLPGDYDIGAAATISPPGNNGFADGVVYFIDKKQIVYALDLTTGTPIWQYDFSADSGNPNGNARSAAALDGNTLVFGMSNGVYAVNATTGAKIYHYTDPAGVEVISNPAIVGPPGQEVVAFGDLAGAFHVLNLASGAEIYHYQTGNYITASPSYVNGHFLIASTDGFLYDFAAGGGNSSPPNTAITSPAQGSSLPYESTVTVQGTASDAVGVNAVQVAVQSGGPSGQWYNIATNSWQNGALTNLVAVANPGAKQSSWSFPVPVPLSGATLQVFANAVNVTQQADVAEHQSGFSVAYSPKAPHLQASAVFIAPAATFSVSGSGFKPNETVTYSVSGTVIGHSTASATGTVSATLSMPALNVFGPAAVSAVGGTSGYIAVAPVDIANNWLQAGANAAHTGFENNDAIFASAINPGGNTYLKMAWYYAAGAAVESSPSVYDAQVFFGNDAGTMTAVQTDTDAPVWSRTIASGAPIRSSPAIDTSTGDLIFTADDGAVYVVSAATGAPVTSATIGGLLTSPTIFSGTVYVGSDNSTVESLNEKTGAVVWSKTLGGAVHATPAFDSSTKVLVTGDDSGAISALNASTGAPIWQAMTGGAVTAAPMISGSTVYVGSGDGNVYALSKTTGKVLWTYSAGTAFTTGMVYDSIFNLVYAGGTNGTLYALNAKTGALAWTTVPLRSPPAPYVGLGAAKWLVFANISSGSLIAYRSSQMGHFNANHPTMGALTTSPAVDDGAVYVGASDGGVYAYTTDGSLPQAVPQSIRRADSLLAARQPHVLARFVQRQAARFSFSGQRDVAVHVDAILHKSRPTARLAYHGGPVQSAARSYLIAWQPVGTAVEKRYLPTITSALRAGLSGRSGPTLAATYIDSAPFPATLSDGAIQAEIAKAITLNHWTAGLNAQFVLLTAPGAIAPGSGFCSYHSAFALGHDRSKPVVYGAVPYAGAVGACGVSAAGFVPTGDAAIDSAKSNLGRVQREMMNDPLLNGWHGADGGELTPSL